MAQKGVKVVVVGDGAVGKTCLLYVYAKKEFPEEYVPTVFENYTAHVPIDNSVVINLGLWDTAGQEEYDKLRPLSYPGTDIFLVCFSVNSRQSFRNVESRWVTELRHHVGNRIPVILVGTKADMRDSDNPEHVSSPEGEQLARRIKAARYLECSAKENSGVKDVFDWAIRIAVYPERYNPNHGPKKPCTIL
eukprot:gnl/Trimastix_PCT/258.p1 GENE.gnl/Trimastix_PCT/258~~gnl/Trimastix_PCT/258.p1  ORF type:complete len:206 (-),score=22.92 gnl/Trimastix_PCT/258:59-631(-)